MTLKETLAQLLAETQMTNQLLQAILRAQAVQIPRPVSPFSSVVYTMGTPPTSPGMGSVRPVNQEHDVEVETIK